MRLKIILLFIIKLFLAGYLLPAQNNAAPDKMMDSLKQVLKYAQHDSTRCAALNAMIEAETDDNIWPQYNEQLKALSETNLEKYQPASTLHTFFLKQLAAAFNNKGYLANIHGNTPEALQYFEAGLAMDKRAGNKAGISSSLNNIGSLYQSQGDIKKALDYFNQSLILSQETKDKRGMAESFNNIGLIYNEQGDIPAALDNYHKSLKIQQEIHDKKGMAISLNNLGAIYQQQGDTARALNDYNKSLKIQEEINDMQGIAGSLHNIGHIYFEQGNISKALNYFNKSYKISEETGNKAGMAHCLNSIGLIYNNKNDVSKALDYWRKGLKLCEEINDKQSMSSSLNRVATALFRLDQVKSAQEYCERSLKLAQELGFPEDIKTASGNLSEIYAKTGNWKKAFEMLALHKRMNDNINNETSRRASLQKTFQYEYEKKTVADSIKAVEQRKLFDVQIKQQKTQRTALYFGIGLLTLFALFMYNRFRVTQKQKRVIELKEKETQQQKSIIEEKHKEINDSINYAERIQRSFLATGELLDKYLKEYFVLFKPKAIVSGDFYWAAELDNGNFAFAVADSTGHGVPGAIMSLLNITSLEKAIEHLWEPADILNHTRKIIIERLKKDGSSDGGKDGMDCSLISFDFKNSKLVYAAANNPVWIVRANKLLEFAPDKMPVGKHDKDNISFTQHAVDIQEGDIVYVLTDGLPDQFGGPKGKKFMYKKLKELLINVAHLPMHEQEEKLTASLNNWKGNSEQVDDITIVGIRV